MYAEASGIVDKRVTREAVASSTTSADTDIVSICWNTAKEIEALPERIAARTN